MICNPASYPLSGAFRLWSETWLSRTKLPMAAKMGSLTREVICGVGAEDVSFRVEVRSLETGSVPFGLVILKLESFVCQAPGLAQKLVFFVSNAPGLKVAEHTCAEVSRRTSQSVGEVKLRFLTLVQERIWTASVCSRLKTKSCALPSQTCNPQAAEAGSPFDTEG